MAAVGIILAIPDLLILVIDTFLLLCLTCSCLLNASFIQLDLIALPNNNTADAEAI